jgi:hypothetical protein
MSNIDRLFGAAGGDPDSIRCEECRALLPRYVQAEMEGEDTRRLHPQVASHLDGCIECGAIYAEMLDIAVSEERGELPKVEPPPFNLPVVLRLRRLTRQIARAAISWIDQRQIDDVDVVAQIFFERLAGTSERLMLQPSALPLGLGNNDTLALPLVMASYYAMQSFLAKYALPDIEALRDKNALEKVLNEFATEEVKRYNLQDKSHEAFVKVFVEQALSHFSAP